MGSGVARQCSRNSCLTGWAIWIPKSWPPEAEQVERTRRRTRSRARTEVFVPHRAVEVAGGSVLVLMGVLMITGGWVQLFGPLLRLFSRSGWPPV